MGQRAFIQTIVQNNSFGRLEVYQRRATGVNGLEQYLAQLSIGERAMSTLTNEDGVLGGNGMQADGSLPSGKSVRSEFRGENFHAHHQIESASARA